MAVGRTSYQTAFAFRNGSPLNLGYESERFQVSMLGPVVRKGDVVTDFELPDEIGAPRGHLLTPHLQRGRAGVRKWHL